MDRPSNPYAEAIATEQSYWGQYLGNTGDRYCAGSLLRRRHSWDCGYARALTGKKPTEHNYAYRKGYAAGLAVLANIDEVK